MYLANYFAKKETTLGENKLPDKTDRQEQSHPPVLMDVSEDPKTLMGTQAHLCGVAAWMKSNWGYGGEETLNTASDSRVASAC